MVTGYLTFIGFAFAGLDDWQASPMQIAATASHFRHFRTLRHLLPARLIGALSVRTRIILLALIPVAGFLTNGMSFIAGEQEVDEAFEVYRRAEATAAASQDFKEAINQMRIGVRDFSARPDQDLIAAFKQANAHALDRLGFIERSVQDNERLRLSWLPGRLQEVGQKFDALVGEQRKLGFNDGEGLRRRLHDTGIAVERVINERMHENGQSEAARLLISLLAMRRYEAEQRVQSTSMAQTSFAAEYDNFLATVATMNVAPDVRADIAALLKTYVDTFRAWSAATDAVRPNLRLIDLDTQQMVPAADEIIQSAREGASQAAARLSASQHRTKLTIIFVGCAAVLVGLALSWLIGRSITGPLQRLSAAMRQLAKGDTAARIPATRARHEIGDMARSVIVFRDTMLEREHLAQAQSQTGREREARARVIATTIAAFERSVNEGLTKVRDAAERLETASSRLNEAADGMSQEARNGENQVLAASGNIADAAGSVEELAASIVGIAGQTQTSTEVAGRAVAEARRTATTMSELANAATRIGEVITMIQAIAGQTNLLALNATIEAARAGEAGRGFAVVAAEVKSLAGQTARATQEIAGQIGAIQSASADAAQAIDQVNGIIKEMSAIAAQVADTVEQQSAAVSIIAEGVNGASSKARSGADAMSRVALATTEARATAADVKSLADALASEAEGLDLQVRQFLIEVQTA